MSIFVPLLEYGVIISYYSTIAGADVDKLANIYLKKFNYEKIFYKERIAKFNKKKTTIKDL